MFGPFALWSTTFRFPLSGDVSQEIEPQFLTDFNGVPEVEAAVLRDVGSYGRQLGWIIEALQTLSEETGTQLPKIEEISEQIADIKQDHKRALRAHAEDALSRLKDIDADVLRDVVDTHRS